MVWNHRVVKREQKLPDGMVDITYHIHEAYYDEKPVRGARGLEPGAATNITLNATAPMGETLLELREELERFLKAVNFAIENGDAVLNHEDF
jgi:hypothetical protein